MKRKWEKIEEAFRFWAATRLLRLAEWILTTEDRTSRGLSDELIRGRILRRVKI